MSDERLQDTVQRLRGFLTADYALIARHWADEKQDRDITGDVEDLLSRLDSQAAGEGRWLPIESAPKDGTEILAGNAERDTKWLSCWMDTKTVRKLNLMGWAGAPTHGEPTHYITLLPLTTTTPPVPVAEPEEPTDLAARLWEALKWECCKLPEQAKTIVFLSEDKFRQAVARVIGAAGSETRRRGNPWTGNEP
jgi:hypothetical protein